MKIKKKSNKPGASRVACVAAKELAYHMEGIAAHYRHAKEKHPYFCDWFKPDSSSKSDMERVATRLCSARARISSAIETGNLGWDDILNCEVWEIMEALAIGDMAHAKEEVYDAVAVLLRLLDVIDGLQELGCIGKKEKKA